MHTYINVLCICIYFTPMYISVAVSQSLASEGVGMCLPEERKWPGRPMNLTYTPDVCFMYICAIECYYLFKSLTHKKNLNMLVIKRNNWWYIIKPKNPNLGEFWRVVQLKLLEYFMAIWPILQPFGIYCSNLVYYLVIWYICPRCAKKNLATLHPIASSWQVETRRIAKTSYGELSPTATLLTKCLILKHSVAANYVQYVHHGFSRGLEVGRCLSWRDRVGIRLLGSWKIQQISWA
jgi:hypothetical protein